MPAEVVCTVCGARQPLVAVLESAAAREAWTAALALVSVSGAQFAEAVAAYVDWFAVPEKAPQARTVVRVLEDLTARIQGGSVRIKGITRAAPLPVWIDAMRLIAGGHTEASRPLTTNGYLAGIVWNRAEAAGGQMALAPATGPEPVATERARPELARAHLQGEIRGLRAMLAGAHSELAQESLHRQIAIAESRLAESTGEDHGTGV